MKRTVIAAGAAVALVGGGAAWLGLSSATATSQAGLHGWPATSAYGSGHAAIAAARADARQNGARVVVFRATQLRHADIDVGGDGFSPGDYFVFEERVRDLHGSTIVGRDSVKCTFNVTTYICDGTLQLFGKGEITVYGAFFGEQDNRIAVTGGTGLFQGISGQLTTQSLRHHRELLILELHT